MIELSIGIAFLGSCLLIILALATRATLHELRLKKHRHREAGLMDLLNYAAVVEDGIIVNKNGSLMMAWLYRGEDNASSTEREREVISFRLNQALSRLGNGWMVHFDAVRQQAPSYSAKNASHFSDKVSLAIDEERRRFFESLGTLYEGYFVLTVTWFPPLLAQRKFVELMFEDEGQKLSQKSQTLQLIDMFKRECLTLESRLSAAVSLERLKGRKVTNGQGNTLIHDDFLKWLQYCITGLHHPIQLPKNPIYLDALIGSQELWAGVIPKIGRKFIQTIAVEGFPLESFPGILTALAEIPIDYRWSTRFIFMDHHEAIKHLEKFRKKWKQKIRGFMDQLLNSNSSAVDEDAVAMVADAASAIAETNSGLVAQGYYTSVLVVMDESREAVEAAARKIEKLINSLAFTARIETINTLDAFLGSLPGHGVENVRRPLLNTFNLSDLIPTSFIWTGEKEAPCPLFPAHSPALMQGISSGNSIFNFNLHVRDLGHTVMFGPTRSGKSTHLGLLALQFRRYKNARIFAFDKGMSMYPACRASGGSHYIIGSADEKIAFAPLSRLDSRARRAWAMEWIDTILALNGLQTTPAQRNEIGHAIMSMSTSGSKTLSEFSVTIQDEAIREALKQYTVDGLMGHLLDAEEDNLSLSDFTTFEIEELMGLGEKFALPVLLYLFQIIEESLDGRPTLISLDEVWLLLSHPVFREKIREWLKTLAKKNVSVIMATQNLSDAKNSSILDVIIESTATKIFLPNPYANDEETTPMYVRMGLNARQIEIIAAAVPKRDYYFISERGCRLYQLALGPLTLAFVGATDKDSLALIKKCEAKNDDWVSEWLNMQGLNLKDYLSIPIAQNGEITV
jgi:type IV secretion/conjugal transfer VirB4 family ATPase